MSRLLANQYCHILNNDTGEVRIEVGPKRIFLKGNEIMLGGVKSGTIIKEDQYCIIKNPYDEEKKKYLMGDRQVVVGPAVITLAYNSQLEEVRSIPVLSKLQAIRLQSIQSHDGKPAGFVWQVKGPCRFIPNKFTKILKTIDTVLINQGEGLYIQNTKTSEKKLVKGPRGYLLEADEDFFYKQYTDIEAKALRLRSSKTKLAKPIHLKKGQVLCVLNAEKKEKYICGPKSVLLEHDEHVKVLQLAKGKPKVAYQIKAAIINLGPDFMSDKFEARTKDNAHLTLLLTYKWEFVVDEKQIHKVFMMPDFIGYSCNTLTSLIREEVSKYNFEDFHKNAVGFIRKSLFKDHVVKDSKGNEQKFNGHFFPEINFLVTEVDVKKVEPVNREINNLLNQSIKANMRIVCEKMEQEARLLAQKEKIKGDQALAELKKEMIEIENRNLSLEQVGKAKIEGAVKVLEADFQKKIEEMQFKSNQGLELERMQKIIGLLKTPEGKKYLKLLKSQNINDVQKTLYVQSDSKVNLPF